MRFHGESSRSAYDAIVVGSGIGGLTAAALLARAGRSVLVVERHDRPGGFAHSFRRSRYVFDSAVHLVGGCGARGGRIHDLLDSLGVRERCEFTAVDPLYTARFPDFELAAPSGIDEFVRAHAAAFPREEKGIGQILQECLGLASELARLAEIQSHTEALRGLDRFPLLLRYRRATLGEVLDAHLEDPRAKAALGTLWPYLGLPPSRVSFVYWANMWMSYIANGAYYCRGTFQQLANTLVEAIERDGGEVLFRSSVRRIRVEDGRTVGITLENGQRIDAPVVISNADATQTVEELVGEGVFPARYLRATRRMRHSISAFVVYAATTADLRGAGIGHETFCFDSWDHDASYAATRAGRPSWLSVTAPTLADPSLAPPGEHLLVLTTLVAADGVEDWSDAKAGFTDQLLERAASRLPALAGSITFAEGATPRTMERYTRSGHGSIYGWELAPDQVGPARLGGDTPIAGLHLAGHWTQPGGGITGVVDSGVQAARSILGCPRESDLWRALAKR